MLSLSKSGHKLYEVIRAESIAALAGKGSEGDELSLANNSKSPDTCPMAAANKDLRAQQRERNKQMIAKKKSKAALG